MFNSLSCSALKCYEICPRKFKFEYIDRLGSSFRKDKPYLSFARSVHSALAEILRKKRSIVDKYSIELALLSAWDKTGYRDFNEESTYFRRAVEIIEKFVSTELDASVPLYVEDYFRIKAGEFTVTGRIDRIDSSGSDGLVVIDYKTGRYLPTAEEVSHDMQMRIYALAVYEKYKKFPASVVVHFLEHGRRLEFKPSKEDLELITEEIKQLFSKIISDMEFSPKINPLCSSCDYISICRYSEQNQFIRYNQLLQDIAKNLSLHTSYILKNTTIMQQIHLDSLTKLYNRRYLQERLSEEMVYANEKKSPLSLAMMDIDFFKRINDELGHIAGDRVLVEVASLIKEQTGTRGISARYGGEEFICVLPGINLNDAVFVGEAIRSSIECARICIGEKTLGVTVSIGVAHLSDQKTPEEIIHCADMALYRAKNSGRNRVVY
ncbi:MAG: diguanylate cyclase [Elusimicrobiota bacterium]